MRRLTLFSPESCVAFPLPFSAEWNALPALKKAGFRVSEKDGAVYVGGAEAPLEELVRAGREGWALVSAEDGGTDLSIKGLPFVRMGGQGGHIRFLDAEARFFLFPGKMEVLDNSGLYLNGRRARTGATPLRPGDCLWAGSTRIILREAYITCCGKHYESKLNAAAFVAEKGEDFPVYMRSPRIIKRAPHAAVELLSPPQKEERKKGELVKLILPPLLMAAVTVGMGVMMGRGIFVLVSAAGMALSTVFSVTSFLNDRKDRRRREKERAESYESYLLAQRKRLHELREAQRESLLYHYQSPGEIDRAICAYSNRIYERAANDGDFLTLSLGTATADASYPVKFKDDPAEAEKDPLCAEMRQIGLAHQTIPDLPAVIDLKEAHLGLVGEKASIRGQLEILLLQLCFYQSYHDIEVIFLTDDEGRGAFSWARWLPHLRVKTISVSGLVSAENHRDQLLGNLAQVLKARKQKQEEEKKESRYLPHFLFFIDNPKLILNHSVMEYLQTPGSALGFSLVYTTHLHSNLPENIRTVLLLEGGGRGTLLMNAGEYLNRPVRLLSAAGVDLEKAARKLAPLRHSQGVSTQIPESVSFFDLYGVKRADELPVLRLWAQNACHKSLAVPLGLRGKDDVVYLNLHEKAHGPHGLVAGTTGSGKSEILQSYILSLAVNFHPHEVGFLLIDYKGGGMANLFSGLPHLLGVITNLDGGESMRALASIRSENARRQRVFGEAGVNSINEYTKRFKAGEVTLPLPHLFIISDEFAELKKEQPDFMSELVSVARIGRSLGVHLILATQKPSGVVDDQIWSNSRFKLALKVANEADSNEVLKTPDAARITQPGRSYLQVGNNEIYELFQSAWSGAPYSEATVEKGFDSRVYLLNQLGQGDLLNEDLSEVNTERDSKLTQLDVVAEHIRKTHESTGAAPVEKPWLPPLADKIVTPHIVTATDVGTLAGYTLSVPIGMMDIPEAQLQREYEHDFLDDGNFAVFGASGSGKSVTLLGLALTLASRNSPELLKYFILDFGNSAMTPLKGLPHTADHLSFDDGEKLAKLVKLLGEALKKRKNLFAEANAINFKMYNELAEEKLPVILLFIDNYDVVREIGTELEDFLTRLTRDGPGVGIFTVVAASRLNAMRYAVANNFKGKISHYMTDQADVTAVVGRSAYKLSEQRGRALVKRGQDVHVMQCYLPAAYEDDISYAREVKEKIDAIAKSCTAPAAEGIRVLPETVLAGELLRYAKLGSKLAVAGFDTEDVEPCYLDLNLPLNMIVGGAQSGKTNMLKLILAQAQDALCFIADSRGRDLQDYGDKENVVYMGAESAAEDFCLRLGQELEQRRAKLEASRLRQREFCAAQPPVLLLIDDADTFVELCKAKQREMEALLPEAFQLGVSVVVTTPPGKLRGFDNITKALKDTQVGLVLGNPDEQNFLSLRAPRGYKPQTNMGFWAKRGESKQIKIPFVH